MEIGLPVLDKKFLKGFYHIWAWWSYWSYDQDSMNKLSLSLPIEAPNKTLIGQAVSEKKIFEIVDDDGRTDDGRRSMDLL